MSFFQTATEQRIKEAKSGKTFLSVSLIGSLVVHVGVLASGIGNLLFVTPKSEEDAPIEIAFVEPQTPEISKPLEEKKQQKSSSFVPVPQKKAAIANRLEHRQRTPINEQQKLLPRPSIQESPKITEIPQQQVEQPANRIATQMPQSSATTNAESSTARSFTNNGSPSTDVLTTSGTESSVAFGSGTGIDGNGTNGTGIDGNGNGSNIGDGNGNGSGRGKRGTIATGSSVPSFPTEIGDDRRESGGSGNGRAACRNCDTAYPEAARRKGVEGRVEVAVDTDAAGNVTNVRIVRSSGNRELDEATLRQARDWKLKPSANKRQGTRIATEYAIEGSQRHRQLQESSRQRPTPAALPGRNRRQMETAINRKSPATSTTRQRSRQSNVATRSSNKTPSYTPRRQQSTTQPSRRVRRTNIAPNPVRTSAVNSTRRKRRQPTISNGSNRVERPISRQRREPRILNNRRSR